MSGVLIATVPVSVTVPKDSASTDGSTSLKFGVGGGSYERNMFAVISGADGCSRRVHLDFESQYQDAGFEIDHDTRGVTHLGLRGGMVRESSDLTTPLDPTVVSQIPGGVGTSFSETILYFNPYISWEWTWVGFGAGILVPDGPLATGSEEEYPLADAGATRGSGHFRLGNRSILYVSASTGESVPIYSGGGIYNVGIGTAPEGAPIDVWAGLAHGPWREDSPLVKVGIHPNATWAVNGTIGLEGASANGSVGLTYRIP